MKSGRDGEVKTSLRLTDEDADVFWALHGLTGERPHQLAARLVREGLAREMADPGMREHLDVMLDVLTRQRAADEARALLDNVVDLHTRRRL